MIAVEEGFFQPSSRPKKVSKRIPIRHCGSEDTSGERRTTSTGSVRGDSTTPNGSWKIFAGTWITESRRSRTHSSNSTNVLLLIDNSPKCLTPSVSGRERVTCSGRTSRVSKDVEGDGGDEADGIDRFTSIRLHHRLFTNAIYLDLLDCAAWTCSPWNDGNAGLCE